MHVGRLMARLNPKNVRFDIGSGGVPDLLPSDIAAALAFVAPGLGRELLCRVWWPDGARLSERSLIEEFERLQLAEWGRRETAMLDATLSVALSGSRARALYAEAHTQRWPQIHAIRHGLPSVAPGYARVRAAVLDELCSAGLCPECKGLGVLRNSLRASTQCPKCCGTGHHRISERERATAAGVSWTTYRGAWASVYDWTFQTCMDDIQRANHQFLDALGGG